MAVTRCGVLVVVALALAVSGSAAAPAGRGQEADTVVDAAAVANAPTLRSRPALAYPDGLANAGIRGRVVLRYVIDTAGNVEPASIAVVSPAHPALDSLAAALARGMRYRPARLAGRPVRVLVQVPITYPARASAPEWLDGWTVPSAAVTLPIDFRIRPER